MSRRLASVYTVLRLAKNEVNQGKHRVCHCSHELNNLLRKLWPGQLISIEATPAQVLAPATMEIQSCKAERERKEAAATQIRIQQWRRKFATQDIKRRSSWIRQKEAQQKCVTVMHCGQSAHSDNQASEFIHDYWTDLWATKIAALPRWVSVRTPLLTP